MNPYIPHVLEGKYWLLLRPTRTKYPLCNAKYQVKPSCSAASPCSASPICLEDARLHTGDTRFIPVAMALQMQATKAMHWSETIPGC